MTTDDLYLKINNLLIEWENEKDLANGGCATACYEVARLLEMHSLPYTLMMFVDYPHASDNSAERICQKSACMHMAIVIKYKGSKCSLGVDERFDTLQTHYGAVVKEFKKMTAERIKKMAEMGEWSSGNDKYDHSNDFELRTELEKIFDAFFNNRM